VLGDMLGESAIELATIYGGLPARTSLQDGFFESFGADMFPDQDLNWQVAIDSLQYPDSPNHEAGLPGGTEANDTINTLGALMDNNPDLDLNAELDVMLQELQLVYDANR